MKSVLYICFVVSFIDRALLEELLGARSSSEVQLDGFVNDNGEVLLEPIASDSPVSEASASAASLGDVNVVSGVIGGGSDAGPLAHGDLADAKSPAHGDLADAESPTDGDLTDAESPAHGDLASRLSPTDGDLTGAESPANGDLTGPVSPADGDENLDDSSSTNAESSADGDLMDPGNPDFGDLTEPESPTVDDSIDADNPADGGSSAREGRDNAEESGFLSRTSSTQFLPLDDDIDALPLFEFVRHPEDLLVAAGAAAWLSCRVQSGLGPMQMSWWLDGRQLQRPEVNGTSMELMLDAVQSGRDNGLYHCVADGRFGAVRSLPARVTIASLAVDFATAPGNVTAMAGDAAVFNCSIVSTPLANITWLKDQLPLSDDIVQRAVVDVSGLLAIRQLQSEDAGDYSCVAENSVAGETRRSAAGHLTVVPADGTDRAPRMLLPATSIVNVTLFSGVTLPCVASGFPTPQLQWIQVDESSIVPSAVQRPDGSLTLDRVNNHAIYKCTASNSAGEDVQERDVRVHAAPIIQRDSVLPDRRVLLVPGRLLRLECNALAVPDPPSIDWYKNGRPLVADSAGRVFQRNNTLVISNIHSGDAAMYQCLASNSLGSALHTVQLLVESSHTALHSPANVSASDVTAHSALISWQFPQSNTHLAYSIHYRKLNASDASEKQQVTPGSPYRLQHLDAVSQYEVYVRAYAQKGATDPSHTIVITTGVGVPFRAPKLSVATVNATALNASWVPLSPALANGPVIGYSVTWQLHESQPVGYQLHSPASAAASRSAHLSAVHHWHLITGLNPGAVYGVSVRAATRAGYGNVTADVTWVQMPSDDIAASSPHLSLVATSHSTIRVLWVPPEDTTVVPTGYQLTYRRRRVDSRVEDVVKLPVDARQYDLTGLAESRWYVVRLRALLVRPGDVSESVRSIRTLSSSNGSQSQPPDPTVVPPVQVWAEPLNATAALVEWQPPSSTHDISFYSVQYWRLGEEQTALKSLFSTDPGVVVTGLVPDSVYAFQVRSQDDTDHHGPYTDAIKVRTLEGVPTAPGTVVWSTLSVSSVRVSWQPPVHSHGNITVYRLLYTDQPDSPIQDWLSINSTTTHAPVCRLLANQQYSVRVQGGTAAGLGELSNITRLVIKASLDGTGYQLSPVAYGVVAGVCVLLGVLLCAALCWTLVWWRSRRRQRLRWCSRRAPLYPETSGGWRPHTNGRLPSAPGGTRLELEPLTRPAADRSATIVSNIATTPATNKGLSGNGNGSLLRLDPPRSSPRRSSTRVAVGDGHTHHPAAASADESCLDSSSVALINNQSVVA